MLKPATLRIAPRAVVVVFPGSNGDRDLAEAFAAVGFAVTMARSDEPLPPPDKAQVIGLPGGFSYGDYWRAGMLASRDRAVRELPERIAQGALCIGICNGFQILVEAGLLDGALGHNAPPGFRHRMVTVQVTEAARRSPWFFGLAAGTTLRLPLANGEGRYDHVDGAAAIAPRVPLAYVENPNGSLAATAALCDATGRVLGVMPHPERAIDPLLGSSDGLRLFAAAAAFCAARGASEKDRPEWREEQR
jgi:phosphoribosylformylglycinamidine synthase